MNSNAQNMKNVAESFRKKMRQMYSIESFVLNIVRAGILQYGFDTADNEESLQRMVTAAKETYHNAVSEMQGEPLIFEEVYSEAMDKASIIVTELKDEEEAHPGFLSYFKSDSFNEDLDNQEEQAAGTCPCCGEPLTYSSERVYDGASVKQEWKCSWCEATGTEWSDAFFFEHVDKNGAPFRRAMIASSEGFRKDTCPHCGAVRLNGFSNEKVFHDGDMDEPWGCPMCGCEGTAVSTVVFNHHEVHPHQTEPVNVPATYIALFNASSVRDVQVYRGPDGENEPLSENWEDQPDAEVFIGLFHGTEDDVLRQVCEQESCTPACIRLMTLQRDSYPTVDTPKGTLSAKVRMVGKDYPGIDVFHTDESGVLTLVTAVEYSKDRDRLQAIVYSTMEDAPTDVITIVEKSAAKGMLPEGFRLETIYANKTGDGGYGDIFDTKEEVLHWHPGAEVLTGYCVVELKTGCIPEECKGWNDTIDEAIADFRANCPAARRR